MKRLALTVSLLTTVALPNGFVGAAFAEAPPAPEGQPGAKTADSGVGNSGDIVVVAQRQAQRFVDVPASISVITQEQLQSAGVNGTRDLSLLTPGLTITQQGAFAQPNIRGVGTTLAGTGTDPNVALYVDGVYVASQIAALLEFNGIAQIETLKGPQGSLYGRNATGGAIVVTTKLPKLGELSGSGDFSYGRFREVRASTFVNVPISDTVALNIAAYNRSNSGYTKNIARGNENSSVTESRGVRGRLLFEPSDSLRFTLSGTYVRQDDNTAFSYAPYQGNVSLPNTQAAIVGLGKDFISLNTQPTSKLDYKAASFNVDLSGDWGKLTSISSFAYIQSPFTTDIDGTEVSFQGFAADPYNERTVSQELIYTSPKGDRFSWIGGLYYINDYSTTQTRIAIGGNLIPRPPFQPFTRAYAEAYAAYAEGTYNLTDKVHLTLGGRYSSERRGAKNNDGAITGPLLLDASKTFNSFTPHAALRYSLTPHSSIYASFSRGFKSGLFDSGAIGTCTTGTGPNCPYRGIPVSPEKVTAYEVGYKYNSGGTLFSASAYWNKYTDIQINALNALNQQILYNAAAAEIYGAEMDLSTHLTDNFSVRLGGAYTHGEYTDFRLGQNFTPVVGGGNLQVTGDDTGHRVIRTPRISAYVSSTYEQPLASGSLSSTVTLAYSSSYPWHADNRLWQKSSAILNANLTWHSEDKHFKVTVFGENLTDRRRMLYVREAVVGDFVSYSKPRTWGVGFGFGF